jgi:DMSO/TMAO reductase YedYZ molybdopterin-dependent catalytic subunit
MQASAHIQLLGSLALIAVASDGVMYWAHAAVTREHAGRTAFRAASLGAKTWLAANLSVDSLDGWSCRISAMSVADDPIPRLAERAHTSGDFAREEVRLANRNSGLPLEALRHDVTPAGLHFLLTRFDVPHVAAVENWRLDICGCVRNPTSLSLAEIQKLPARTLRVTLECAGNGRANLVPRWPTQPWEYGAVGTAEWTGTPLRAILERAGLEAQAVEIAFFGADRGFDGGFEHDYGRSLAVTQATREDILVAWAMNGTPLPPQHGFPLRLVVPGWYGMASVKWLTRIEALAQPFTGYQQVRNYMYRENSDDPGIPVSTMRVKSLMVPPGIPDFLTRRRVVDAGAVQLVGRAWSGGGRPVAKVEVGVGGHWREASLDPPQHKYAWQQWHYRWNATPGEYELACRATSADGESQPLSQRWDSAGFGNNAVQRVQVTVRP